MTQKNLASFINENISRGAIVNTDQHHVYGNLLWPIVRKGGRHYVVNHSQKEYARRNPDGSVSHVNNCESFFSLLKRGIMGTFHCVSKEHLHRYCDEFAFRWNTRKQTDGERLIAAVKNSIGKRLLYAEAVGG